MSKKVCMTREAFQKEHEKLPKVLRQGTAAERREEAAEQAKELRETTKTHWSGK